MLKLVGALIAFVVVGSGVGTVFAGQDAAEVPAATLAEAAKMPNPVKPTEESIAKAKKLYSVDCAMCHGEDGSGKGEVAVGGGYTVKDYRKAETLKDRKDGELFYIIHNGQGKMPAEGDRAKTDVTWNLVIYLRSFSDPSVLPGKK